MFAHMETSVGIVWWNLAAISYQQVGRCAVPKHAAIRLRITVQLCMTPSPSTQRWQQLRWWLATYFVNFKYIDIPKIRVCSFFIKHPAPVVSQSVSQWTCAYSVSNLQINRIKISNYLHMLENFGIPHFRCVFMRDTLLRQPHSVKCGIVNLNRSSQPGSHWVCYYGNKNEYTLTHTDK